MTSHLDIRAEKEDNKKLLAGRYSEISPESLLVYRKRLRAFGLQDVIAETLGLEPLPPNAEEDKAVRRALRHADHADTGLCHATVSEGGGLWIPVDSTEALVTFFEDDESEDSKGPGPSGIRQPVPIEGEDMEGAGDGEDGEEPIDTTPLMSPVKAEKASYFLPSS